MPGKIYRGPQLVMFGQYDQGGEAELVLKAPMTGEDKVYRASFTFPEVDTENPELERLWALDQIEQIEDQAHAWMTPFSESKNAIRDLGLHYQLVTDETSMPVLADSAFQRHGIERKNQQRVQRERAAQSARAVAPTPVNRRVDTQQPLTPSRPPSFGGGGSGNKGSSGSGGGGAFSLLAAVLLGGFGLILAGLWRSKPAQSKISLPRILAIFGGVVFFAKCLYELGSGQTLFVSAAESQFVPAVSAHLVGALCGLASGLVQSCGCRHSMITTTNLQNDKTCPN